MSTIEDSILQITQKSFDQSEDKRLGTGFIINENGYLVTARHVIPNIKELNDIYAQLNQQEYKVKKIESNDIVYNREDVDILLLQLVSTQKFRSYLNINHLGNSREYGQAIIIGFPNSSKTIKTEILTLYGANNNQKIELSAPNEVKIQTGCSGSPVFLLKNNKPTHILGVFSHTDNSSKNINNIFSINQLEDIGYKLKVNSQLIKEQCESISKATQKRGKDKHALSVILAGLHYDFEHKLIEIEDDLRSHYRNRTITFERLRSKFNILLFELQQVFKILCGDISVHIKLVQETIENGKKIKLLQTFTRVRSEREARSNLTRSKDEKFLITTDVDINLLKSSDYDGKKINSAYNEIYNGMIKSFVCNDLEYAVNNMYYYSTSDKYDDYYNSLAVFPINNKLDSNLDDLKALLIIDSYEKGAFDKQLTNSLGGYFAHRINRAMSSQYCEILFEKSNVFH